MSGAGAVAQAARPIQFHALGIGKDDGLAGVYGRCAIGVAPEDVEAGGAVHRRHAGAQYPKELLQQRLQDRALHFAQEAVRPHLLAVGVLHAAKAGKGPQAFSHAGDDQIRAAAIQLGRLRPRDIHTHTKTSAPTGWWT